jgi:CRISP-associated protein Cas1
MDGLPPPKPIMLKERSSMLFLQYGELDVIDDAFVLVDKTDCSPRTRG